MKKTLILSFIFTFIHFTVFLQAQDTRIDYFTPEWAVDLGFNNFLEDGQFPSDNNQIYGLNNFGSRYIAGSGAYGLPLIKNALDFRIGLEFGIHNFMFENNNYIQRNESDNNIGFADYQQSLQEELEKSKLVVSYLSLPASLRINIGGKKRWNTLHINLGGYAGYRLFSYSSIKRTGQNSKKRTHDSFGLNSWRYGLEGSIGIDAIHLFVKYDLNELFVDDQLPKLNVITFGVRVWGSEYVY